MRWVVKIGAAVLIGAGACAALEIAARYSSSASPTALRYRKISQGFRDLAELERDLRIGKTAYADYQLYTNAPRSTPTFTITPYYSSRRTPASFPREDADTIVWTFGGSTMQNAETSDDLSIANAIATTLAAAGLRPRVENFGIGSFQSSLEFIQFSRLLARVSERERPQIAAFYDGFNDPTHGYLYGAGAIQSDLSQKVGLLVEHNYGRLTLYALSAWLAEHSVAWTSLVHNRLQARLFNWHVADASEANLAQTIAIYLNNVRMIQGVCRAYRISCFFVLQPLVVTKHPLAGEEGEALRELPPPQVRFVRAFYQRVAAALGQEPDFIDASHILDGRAQSDFYDLGHTGALTSPIIGRALGEALLTRQPAQTSAARR